MQVVTVRLCATRVRIDEDYYGKIYSCVSSLKSTMVSAADCGISILLQYILDISRDALNGKRKIEH